MPEVAPELQLNHHARTSWNLSVYWTLLAFWHDNRAYLDAELNVERPGSLHVSPSIAWMKEVLLDEPSNGAKIRETIPPFG
jgi:hypothetical protein